MKPEHRTCQADFEMVPAKAGSTRCTDWDEMWHRGAHYRAKFHQRCNPQNWNFFTDFIPKFGI